MNNTCPPTAAELAAIEAATTCPAMLGRWLQAYTAVQTAMMSGKSVIKVKFGEEEVTYQAVSSTLALIRNEIAMLHRSCPSTASAAVLGYGGGNGGPLRVSMGCPPQVRRSC